MLEARHLTRIYRDKGGVETRALDDVSVKFGDTGLIFILGKSGCGKSTFLNCVGGLDAPTSGEIIVNGRSSLEFSEADFDAYRNTCVGFVFQEYNVLDEFSIEDNVSLALELQREKDVKGRVQEILQEVELAEFAKRKPNTLSGGQKQRIAIARALVKDPQIIMADEPTGALDSGTGWQVLDTLRKLSKTRLVMVVSHDRDFAEEFGDRIIELSDGRIISDVTKVREESEEFEGNIRKVGPNILSIKGGASLTEENIRDIQAFVSAGTGDIIITNGEAEVEGFKKANGITDEYAVESFMNTQETPQGAALAEMQPDGRETAFIRSRLPFAKAIKMGASSLRIKPVRLVFTILLSVIAFVFFGFLSSLMTYNVSSVAARSFANSDDQYLNLTKYYEYQTETYTYSTGETSITDYKRHTYFNEADADALGLQDAVFAINDYNSFIYNASFEGDEMYYKLQFNKAVYAPEGTSVRDSLLYGSYPVNLDEDNPDNSEVQVCISSFLAESIIHSDFADTEDLSAYDGGYKEIEWGEGDMVFSAGSSERYSMENVIGRHLVMNDNTYFTVVGIFDAGDIPSRYSKLKDPESGEYSKYSDLYYEFNQYLADSMDENILVTREYIAAQSKAYDTMPSPAAFDIASDAYYLGVMSEDGETMDKNWTASPNAFAAYGENSLDTVFIDGTERTSLADDEMIISVGWLMNKAYADFSASAKEQYEEGTADYMEAFEKFTDGRFDTEDEATTDNISIYQAMQGLFTGSYDYTVYETETYTDKDGTEQEDGYYAYHTHTVTESERAELIQKVNEYLTENPASVTLCRNAMDSGAAVGTFKVVGYYTGTAYTLGISTYGVYLSENMYSQIPIYSHTELMLNYELPSDADFYYIIVPIQHKTSSWLKPLMKQLETADEATGVIYSMANNLYDTILEVDEVMTMLIIIFLVAGIVFAVFAALLMFNFISVSIAGKQKEIGILRAVGAKGGDVFKIFFSEAAIIALICFVLALILTGVAVLAVNAYIQAEFLINVTIIIFSGWCVLMMLAIAVIVAFLGTFFPVYNASKKKPVESIRAL
ncbi:MAG: ATP-binding cassette domain-containing protein [Clostridia bacterium]|nr:ATP-binding cassette domain-containing protein [Clostridia bacterium]